MRQAGTMSKLPKSYKILLNGARTEMSGGETIANESYKMSLDHYNKQKNVVLI